MLSQTVMEQHISDEFQLFQMQANSGGVMVTRLDGLMIAVPRVACALFTTIAKFGTTKRCGLTVDQTTVTKPKKKYNVL